jgi:glutamate 5-kinase
MITLGSRPTPLGAVEEGARSTVFVPSTTPAAAYKSWIAGSLAPQGVLVVDAGAGEALRSGKSLLPAGVRAVEGRFEKGDAVIVRDLEGREIGRGLTRYDAGDAAKIAGVKSGDIEAALGFTAGPTLIHADDLALAR